MSRPQSVQFSSWKHPISPYDILGVSRSASQAEIRKAYRKRALETHPDKQYQFGATAEEGLAAEELFRQVTEAFDLLNDEYKRRVYDIHSRPPPKPVVRSPTSEVHPSCEASATSNIPSSHSLPKPTPLANDTPRAQDRAEWVRKEKADHSAWKHERTKSFYIPTPAPTPASTLASASTPAPNPAPEPAPSKSHDRRSRASSIKEPAKPKKELPPDYNEWADRILAELYYMMPELTTKVKPAPQREAGAPSKMRTSPA